MKSFCTTRGCNEEAHARRLCKHHYTSWRYYNTDRHRQPLRGYGYLDPDGPLFCDCTTPNSDGLECRTCHRRTIDDLNAHRTTRGLITINQGTSQENRGT